MAWLLITFAVTIYLVQSYAFNVAVPLEQALSCTCTGEGEHCYEAQRFSPEFWDTYWSETVPNSIVKIKEMSAAQAFVQTEESHDEASHHAEVHHRRKDRAHVDHSR